MLEQADQLFLAAMAQLPAYAITPNHRRNQIHVFLRSWLAWLDYQIAREERRAAVGGVAGDEPGTREDRSGLG